MDPANLVKNRQQASYLGELTREEAWCTLALGGPRSIQAASVTAFPLLSSPTITVDGFRLSSLPLTLQPLCLSALSLDQFPEWGQLGSSLSLHHPVPRERVVRLQHQPQSPVPHPPHPEQSGAAPEVSAPSGPGSEPEPEVTTWSSPEPCPEPKGPGQRMPAPELEPVGPVWSVPAVCAPLWGPAPSKLATNQVAKPPMLPPSSPIEARPSELLTLCFWFGLNLELSWLILT